MANKLYRGIRQNALAKVFVDNVELDLGPSKLLHPTDATVEFGYFGDGPSQTALAIMLDATEDPTSALKYYQDFKFDFIANAEYNVGFTILQSQVVEWLERRIDGENKQRKGWDIP